jgi:hypothetical protein
MECPSEFYSLINYITDDDLLLFIDVKKHVVAIKGSECRACRHKEDENPSIQCRKKFLQHYQNWILNKVHMCEQCMEVTFII